MNKTMHKLFRFLPLCNSRCHRYLITALWLFLLLYPAHQYYYFEFDLSQWDLLLFTGVATFIAGLHIVATVPEKFQDAVTRLQNRRIIIFDETNLEQLFQQIREEGDLWARIVALLAALAMTIAFVVALTNKNFDWQMVLLGVGEIIGAYIAGTYLGRMANYGQFGWHLKKLGLQINTNPLHVDGVAGLKPIGDFYYFQAMVVAIPTIFLALWWFLFPVWPRDYTHWEDVYLGLISATLLLEILTFVLPIWSFHRIMQKQKADLQLVADTLSNEISELQHSLYTCSDSDEKILIAAQIEDKTKRYWAIENMVTWPVDLKTKRKFRINNILLFVPIMGDIAKRNVDWPQILNALKQLIS